MGDIGRESCFAKHIFVFDKYTVHYKIDYCVSDSVDQLRSLIVADSKLQVRERDEIPRIFGHAEYSKINGIEPNFFVPVTGTGVKVPRGSAIPR